MFIAGFRNDHATILAVHAREDLIKAVQNQPITGNPTATDDNLRNINEWDVSHVTDMQSMFEGSQFNHPINNWNVRNVTNMSEMFDSSQFNQPLHSWNVDNVRDMSYMFIDSQFNHPLETWNITNVIEMPGMFFNSRITEIPASWHLSPRNRYYIFSDPDGSDEEFRNSTPEVTPEVTPEFVINTVETELSSRTYNLDITVTDYAMIEDKTIRQVFEGKNSNDEVEEDEDEIKDNIIILNHDLTTGSVIKLSDLSRNIREFVECKDDAPPDWQGNTYLDEWLKDGARMTTLITGPGGSNVHIEKPPWFYDGPVPFDRVFVLQERPPKMNKFVTTKLLPIPANPPADLALGADHCNQTSDSTIYTLVALTQERGRGGRVKKPKKKTRKKPKKKTRKKPKKGPKKSKKPRKNK